MNAANGAILFLGVAMAGKVTGQPAEIVEADRIAMLNAVMEKLRPLHKKPGPPQPSDWLAAHEELGQSFKDYIRSEPVIPRGTRHVVYIQPLGEFGTTQRLVVKLTGQFVGDYFGLEVKINNDIPLSSIPESARRRHPTPDTEQILTTYVLDNVLRPRLLDDAAALIALTPSDLWPGEGWNFVFGEASLTDRVGVWSTHRYGDPGNDQASFRLCLLRSLKTATHEIGHMFSMQHCIAYECNMAGSNNLEESDRGPLALCPECLAKVCWATGVDPVKRFEQLVSFCRRHGLAPEAAYYAKALDSLSRK